MGDAETIHLPRSLASMWGRDDAQRRGPKPGLSLESIAAAAIKVADAEGLGAVSMSRVASELGFTTMSLYRYVRSKDELIMLMFDVAGGRPDLNTHVAEGWRARLERWSLAYLSVLQRHPWMTRIPISGPPITPNQVAWMEAALDAMAGTGLTDTEKLSVLLLLSNYVRSVGQLSADLAQSEHEDQREQPSTMGRYGQILSQLIDAERFPALCHALASGSFDEPDDFDQEVMFGLRTVLDGVAKLVQERQHSTKTLEPALDRQRAIRTRTNP